MSDEPSAHAVSPDRRVTAVAVIVIALLIVLYGASLLQGRPAPRAGASFAELHSEPDDVVGERWALGAEVREVLAEDLVMVGPSDLDVTSMPVLLTGRARSVIDEVRAGDVGQFVGRFRRLDVDRLERQARTDLPDRRLERLEGDLVLVADTAGLDHRRP